MTIIAFEAKRLFRKLPFLLTTGAILALGLRLVLWEGVEPSPVTMFLPFLAAWIAAADVRADLQSGRLDLVLSRGLALPRFLLTRFFLAVSVGIVCLVVMTAPLVVSAGVNWYETGGVALRIIYWAAAGTTLGLATSGAGVVVLGSVVSLLVVWWGLSGCSSLTGHLPLDSPWALVTYSSHLVGSFFPIIVVLRTSGHEPLAVETLRLPLAGLLLWVACRIADRRNILAREEG